MSVEDFGSGLKAMFKKLAGISLVDKKLVDEIIRDLQRTLIRADIDIAMVSELSERIRKNVLEGEAPPGMTLKEVFIKTLYDEIVGFLGESKADIKLEKQRILLVGLYGSGKTTSAGKICKWFQARGLSCGLAACDTHRPAAQEQLEQIGKRIGAPVYREGKSPVKIAEHALKASKEDVIIFDSAGRDALDKELSEEIREMKKAIKPDEVFLVIPADIGQVAKRQSDEFNKLVGITGIVITKMDGTAKGGGALAASAVSGARVKFIGTGEKAGDLELYDPKKFVSRLIGYGDIQGLMEKAKEAGLKEETAERIAEGQFTFNEFYEQLKSMQKMGSLSKIMEMLPGFSSMKLPKGMLDVQEDKLRRWGYAIQSMNKEERENPELLKASRVKRIAKGAGLSENDVRELIRYYKQSKKIFRMAKGGKGLRRGPLANIAKQFGLKA